MDVHQLLSFAVAAFLVVLIPGPNMTFLISCAITQGRKAAILGLLGSNAALLSLAFITGLGLNTLLNAVPVIYDILKIAGALYLFWLAWKNILFAKNDTKDEAEVKETYNSAKAFQTGYLTNLLNPKSAAFYVAILPSFLDQHSGYIVLQAMTLGSIHAVISFLVNTIIIFSIRHLTLRYNFGKRTASIKKWGTAIVFTAFGIRMLLQNK